MKHLAVMVWLTFLSAAIGLTLAMPAFAALHEILLKDGTGAVVDAPSGATREQLAEAYNREVQIYGAEGMKRRWDIYHQGKLFEEKQAQWRKENPDRYRKQVVGEMIFRNCMVDKMAGVTEKTAQAFVRQSCIKIAIDPSLYQKWKYSD